MNRTIVFLAALAAIVLPSTAVPAAHGGGGGGTRLTLAPGFSLAFPRGWGSCDPALAHKLPATSEADAAQALCREPMSPQIKARLFYVSGNTLLDMRMYFERGVGLNEEIVRSFEPELLRAVNDDLCASYVRQARARQATIKNCQVRRRSVGGHTWVVSTFSVLSANGHMSTPFREAAIPYGDDVINLEFNFITPQQAQGDKAVDAILDSVALDAPSPAPVPVVQLSPAPGVTISAPRGWRACDAENDARLGNQAGQTFDNRADICAPPFSKGDLAKADWTTFAVVGSYRSAWFGLAHNNGQIVTPQDISLIQADLVGQTSKEQCDRLVEDYANVSAKAEGCHSSVEAIGGHPALVMRVTVTWAKFPMKLAVQMISIPYAQGQISILVTTPVFLESVMKPTVDRVLASMTIQ